MQQWESRAKRWVIRATERRVRRRTRSRDNDDRALTEARVEEPSPREQVETVALGNESERAEIAA
jgi:hypothetical protein